MAVELMMGYGIESFSGNMEEENAVKEATSAGIQSVEKFLRIISQQEASSSSIKEALTEYKAVADLAVNKFKKVISLLDKGRAGHARFRRAPMASASSSPSSSSPPPPPVLQDGPGQDLPGPLVPEPNNHPKQEKASAFKVYCPTPVLRLPPLPQNQNQVQSRQNHQINSGVLVPRNGSLEKKDSAVTTTINFSPSPSISAAHSFMSSLTGETDSVQPSFSSGFQLTNLSQSSTGKPPLSSSSFKRKCNSVDDAALRCGSSAGRCHCSKKRFVHYQFLVSFFFVSSDSNVVFGFYFCEQEIESEESD